MLTTTATFRMLTADLGKTLARTADTPSVARQSEDYLERIVKVKSLDDFFADDRVYRYAMKAHGLEDMIYAKAFMRKVLEEGIDDKKSFANKLADTRYRDFVEAFNFARYGSATTAFDRTQAGTVAKFVRQTLEEDAGRQNEGVRLALYFQRKAPGIKTALGLLADPALLKVTQTALGLPAATAAMDIDKQVALVSERLDIADLKDPKKLATFLQRFTSLWELQNAPAATASPAILFGQPREAGIRPDLLFTIQSLRVGGR